MCGSWLAIVGPEPESALSCAPLVAVILDSHSIEEDLHHLRRSAEVSGDLLAWLFVSFRLLLNTLIM
jgi:hypothetical protein